ncbi:hypothetical protein [Cognaticolwellia mytili]|uniref:hypothetical protein n=1 Tax=Cognaticolwellia mytili TaxID=1888913 RepID=UPI000A1784C9|nr:hypothetical protein [Cognaticolwellia mytili]
MKLDVSNYSTEELFQSLESVDDIQFPEQALLVLKELLAKSGLTIEQIQDSFKSGNSLDIIGTLPVFSTIASDILNANNDVSEKLNRLSIKL